VPGGAPACERKDNSMGDRTSCTLHIEGVVDANGLDRLVEALEDANASKDPDIRQCLLAGDSHSFFHEVNYGEMDSDLSDTLEDLGLSYSWAWDSGDSYSEGITFFDARSGDSEEYATTNGALALTVDDLDNPQTIADIRKWDAFNKRRFVFVVATSQHELLKLAGEGKLPEGYPLGAAVHGASDFALPEGSLSFFSTCVSWPEHHVESEGGLQDMISQARDITRAEFLSVVCQEDMAELERALGYIPALPMEKDYHVTYHASKLASRPVVYFVHSATEHVFADQDTILAMQSAPTPA